MVLAIAYADWFGQHIKSGLAAESGEVTSFKDLN